MHGVLNDVYQAPTQLSHAWMPNAWEGKRFASINMHTSCAHVHRSTAQSSLRVATLTCTHLARMSTTKTHGQIRACHHHHHHHHQQQQQQQQQQGHGRVSAGAFCLRPFTKPCVFCVFCMLNVLNSPCVCLCACACVCTSSCTSAQHMFTRPRRS